MILLAMASAVAFAQSGNAPAPGLAALGTGVPATAVSGVGAPAPSPAPAPSSTPYVLQSGDDIEIKAYNIPELDQLVRVRPDGKISLVLLNDVQAAGYTSERLAEILSADFAHHYRNPRISVIVRGFSSLSVYVGGEVFKPGLVPLRGPTTALQAVVEAGGLKETSLGNTVTLLRTAANGESSSYNLNVEQIVAKREADMVLHAGDILYVPKANINVYVGGEVVRPGLLPLNGELTVTTAVIQAGGLKDSAKGDTAMLVRNEDGHPKVTKVRLSDIVKGKADMVLQPFDIVYVPRSRISKVDRFVDQYIRQVVPFNLSSGFTYILGGTVLN